MITCPDCGNSGSVPDFLATHTCVGNRRGIVTGTNVRYGPELQILGTYRVSTKVDTKKFSGEAAQSIARDYMSPGTVGAVLTELATTGECSLTALLEEIRVTRQQLLFPGGDSVTEQARHAANLDNLRGWAYEVAVEVFDTEQCATCGADITDDRTVCEDCDEGVIR